MTKSTKLAQFINTQIESQGLKDKRCSISPILLKTVIGDELWKTLEIYNSLSKKQRMYIQEVLEKLKEHEF